MAAGLKYFIGNWKMFGVISSFNIINKLNSFLSKDKNNKKYKIIIAPPFTLLETFTKKLSNKRIILSSQNCFHKDGYGAHTGNISPFMIKKIGVNYTIIGHSENRDSGETDILIKEKVKLALNNNLNIILCIGENKKEKKNKKTLFVLKRQLNILKKNYQLNKIIIAYEPVWSIGSGMVPSNSELKRNTMFIKDYLKKKFKFKNPKLLYGGSVDHKTINNLKTINELDGFLIGGASKNSKNFIDIIKNFYK